MLWFGFSTDSLILHKTRLDTTENVKIVCDHTETNGTIIDTCMHVSRYIFSSFDNIYPFK